MNISISKELIQQKLDEQVIKDVRTVLSTKEGRRFFSWITELCRQDAYEFKGNSRDILVWGMRNVGKRLEQTCLHLGLSGVDLMQQAYREYIVYQNEIVEEIRQKQRKDCQ